MGEAAGAPRRVGAAVVVGSFARQGSTDDRVRYPRPMDASDARIAVLDDLAWRRMIADHTDLEALRGAMAAAPITFYGG